MNLSDDDVSSFQRLYLSRFGKEISKEEAHEKGLKLLRLMALSYKPVNEEEFERTQRHREETIPFIINDLP